ncbi:MAG TPA: NUDIX domain-containing protein [Candidatus Paceibacterota bacterium]|nr:NUDIX domain-containing protein [Candidatus Paceibacterota bacterium]
MNTSKTIRGTVTYLVRKSGESEEICLASKKRSEKAIKRGLADKFNGYGGGMESSDTSIETSAMRELREESTVIAQPEDFEKVAEILFVNPWGDYHCNFFLVRKFKGEPQETREMDTPRWFPFQKDTLPFDAMMDSDKYFLLPIADGKKLKGTIWHNDKMNVIKCEIDCISHF